MSHSHNHNHSASKNIKIAFIVNLLFTIIEIIAGIYVNSVAIISDAVHDLGDSLSLGTAWYLQKKSNQKADSKYTYGYQRFSLLGALINSTVLIVGGIYVINEAVERIIHPENSDAVGMMWFAFLGIAVNGYAAWRVGKGKTLNERVVSWHLLEDVIGWGAILLVSIVLQFKNIPWLDPLLSLLITVYILWNAGKNLKETLYLFLQGTPKEIDLKQLKLELIQLDGVVDLDKTHIWSLDGEHHVFSTHLFVDGNQENVDLSSIKEKARKLLHQIGITHSSIEMTILDKNKELFRE